MKGEKEYFVWSIVVKAMNKINKDMFVCIVEVPYELITILAIEKNIKSQLAEDGIIFIDIISMYKIMKTTGIPDFIPEGGE